MESLNIPIWIFAAMEKAGFTFAEIGELVSMLYEYFVQDNLPDDPLLFTGKMKMAFYFAVMAMEAKNENV